MKYGINDTISCIKFCDFLDLISTSRAKSLSIKSPERDQNSDIQAFFPGLNTNLGVSVEANNNSDISPINKNSAKLLKKEKTDFSHINKPFLDMENHFRFYIPVIVSEEIASMKMKDLVQLFRNELLIYDLEKRNGIVFNLPDIIQCSMFGICGIAGTQSDLLKIFERTMNLLKNKILKKEKSLKAKIEDKDTKMDSIDFFGLTSKIKSYITNYNQNLLKK